MDVISVKRRIQEVLTKYKYACIVLLAGIVLMMIPGKNTVTPENKELPLKSTQEEVSVQVQLEEILSSIQGAGEVKVMLTIAQSERTVYQTDSTYSQADGRSDSRTETVIITDNQRNESGLIYQKYAPHYQGAIVIAEGGDMSSVKLAIVEAVSNVTGLGADRISVLKMK